MHTSIRKRQISPRLARTQRGNEYFSVLETNEFIIQPNVKHFNCIWKRLLFSVRKVRRKISNPYSIPIYH